MILDTAWKQIREEGVQALSIRKVADAIEYSVPVIYAHFESKDALLKEYVLKGYRLLTERMETARDGHVQPARQLEAMALAYWDFAGQNVEYYQLMFGLGIPNCEMAREVEEIAAFGRMIGSVIKAAIVGGKHPDASVELKFQSYWSILHGIISIRMYESPCCQAGRKDDTDLGLAILKDTVAGFIYALVG